jgi:hypothetical protein
MLAGQKSVELRSREYACAGKGWPIVTRRCSIAPKTCYLSRCCQRGSGISSGIGCHWRRKRDECSGGAASLN